MLVGGFALTALALAVFGIYGVMAYFVQQQSRDISIRIALGGTIPGVLRLLVGNGMKVVGIGVAVGLLGSLALTRLMASLLFGVRPADPAVLSGVGALLLAVALAACLVPAIRGCARAAGGDPAERVGGRQTRAEPFRVITRSGATRDPSVLRCSQSRDPSLRSG